MYYRTIELFLGVFAGILMSLGGAVGGRRPPIIRKLHHKPLHSMFSADPAPCPCVSNGQPVIKDGFLADDKAKGNNAMSGPIIKGIGVNGTEEYYPADYGNKCESWDQITDPVCKEKVPPAYCFTRWCFVAPECAKSDTQSTWRFPGSELYYSYETCGSFDAFSSYKCQDHDSETDCIEDMKEDTYRVKGNRCAWSKDVAGKELAKKEQVCQPERCQCNGEFLSIMGVDEKEELYGDKCGAWDRQKCEKWQDEPGAKMGIWCCQSWCYVDASCPSAAPSLTKPNLYYSYVACQDSVKELQQCPWPKPTGWQGNPALLSDRSRAALAEPKPEKEDDKSWNAWFQSWMDDYMWLGFVVAGLILALVLGALLCCFCKSNPNP